MGQSVSLDNPSTTNSVHASVRADENGTTYAMYYINLSHRTDRKKEMEHEFSRMRLYNVQRFDAIRNKKGYVGCTQSHIACLKQGIESGADHIVILEDDFDFLITTEELTELFQTLQNIRYDVMLLAYNSPDSKVLDTDHYLLKRNVDSQTCAGYIVNKKYARKLLQNFEEGLQLLLLYDKSHPFAIDQYWKRLQSTDNWYCYHKRSGKQRMSYSDIEKRKVNYGV